MTKPRSASPRQREMEKLERTAMRVNIHALERYHAEETGSADSKMWWTVSVAAQEILKALKHGRGAPGYGHRPSLHGERDSMGVGPPLSARLRDLPETLDHKRPSAPLDR